MENITMKENCASFKMSLKINDQTIQLFCTLNIFKNLKYISIF